MMRVVASKTCILYLVVLLLSISNGQKINSPNYPQVYFNHIDCNYTISSEDPSSTVNLIMNDFNTEQCCDHLQIYEDDNNSSVARLSGRVRNQTFQLKSPVVIRFRTDYSVVSRGFQFSYSALNETSGTNLTCDRVCAPTFRGSNETECGLSTSDDTATTPSPSRWMYCYNPCTGRYFNFYGPRCQDFYRNISVSSEYAGRPFCRYINVYQCYSLCQHRQYISINEICSNENANTSPDCRTTPSPSRWMTCYNPCTERDFDFYGSECLNFYRNISVSFEYAGRPFYRYIPVYQCYSLCQYRQYTSRNVTCSNANANMCHHHDRASTLPEFDEHHPEQDK